MKICYVANAQSIHTQRWVKYFADQGSQVHLISVEPLDANLSPNLTFHPLDTLKGPAVNSAYIPWQISRIVRRLKPDILHAHYASTYGFSAAASGFHPFVLTTWGSDILVEPKKSRTAKWKTHYALRRADQITCDAVHLREAMAALGAAKDKIELVYFGTDTDVFSPNQRDPKFYTGLGLEPHSVKIISIRGLRPIYDVESLVAAALAVKAQVPNAQFVIAGDGEQRPFLEKLASSLGVADCVHFVGSLSGDELPIYLASADVYVSTSLSDGGLSSSTAEAMACGLPVVITDFGDNRKWVTDGEGGFLVPLKNPTLLAERLVTLLRSEDLRKQFGPVNRNVIDERSNRKKEMARVEQIYENLIKGLEP